MSNLGDALDTAMALEGAIGVAVVDVRSGDILLQRGGGACLSLGLATAVNSKLVRANQEITSETESLSMMEDILVTFDLQYHLIRPIAGSRGVEGLFLFLALDRTKGNLAMARRKLSEIENNLNIRGDELDALSSVRELVAAPAAAPSYQEVRGHSQQTTPSHNDVQKGFTSIGGDDIPPFLRDETVMKLLGLR